MKITRSITLTLLLPASLSGQRSLIHIPETAAPVTITLGHPSPDGAGFASLTVRSGNQTMNFHPRNPIACAPRSEEERKKDATWLGIKGMTLDASLCFYRGDYGGPTRHAVLAFVSEGYASNASPVFVLGFHSDGTPYKLLERNELDPIALVSKPDGTALLVGLPSLSQVALTSLDYDPKHDPYATSYDPSAVYILKPEQAATYSLDESQSYNREHYVWAGPHSSEFYVVLYNIKGHTKPFVLPISEASKVMEKAQRRSGQ